MAVKNDKGNVLIKNLLNMLELEREIFESVIRIIEIQYDEMLGDKEINMIKEYCRRNLRTTLTKKLKKYEEFYGTFSENDIVDIILFYKSSAGLKMKEKSGELSQLNQDVIMSILNDKNLNILIERLVADVEKENDDDDDD